MTLPLTWLTSSQVNLLEVAEAGTRFPSLTVILYSTGTVKKITREKKLANTPESAVLERGCGGESVRGGKGDEEKGETSTHPNSTSNAFHTATHASKAVEKPAAGESMSEEEMTG